MVVAFLIFAVAAAVAVFFLRGAASTAVNCVYYALQLLFAGILVARGGTYSEFFSADLAACLFTSLLAVISPAAYYYSRSYLDTETDKEKGMYYGLLIGLSASAIAVYLSNNMAVTWIFLEATTLCTAGIIYHRRSARSLEATWKYIFVCSVGIAMAYLGILLFGAIGSEGGLGYANLAKTVDSGNPLFVKIAFLFILAGYSCKMEIFPLYNIGIDANFAAPSPAAALISTGLVNAGFIALYRTFTVVHNSGIGAWASNVLIIAGLISVLIGAVFLRRTNQYKRIFSYSTVENMGIAVIGLGIGGAGIFAALLHVTGHTLIKSSVFFQLAQVGKTYGHYRVNRTGAYMSVNRTAAVLLLVTTMLLLAFPPSPLFVSELLIFRQIIINGQWWLLVVMVLLLCSVVYNLGRHILRLCFQSNEAGRPVKHIRPAILVPVLVLVVATVALGLWRPDWLVLWFDGIINLS